jgi:formylglycine-generating enzyme required for sulfatase activity
LLPYLDKMGLPGGKKVNWTRMLPSLGSNCFDALMRALSAQAGRAGIDEACITQELMKEPVRLPEILSTLAIHAQPDSANLLFIDQMEELFAAGGGSRERSTAFLNGLHQATQAGDLWVVATIRSDQLQALYDHPGMLSILNSPAHYSLGPVIPRGMRDLIVRPAICAGIDVPTGLVNKLLDDVSSSPGSLPLLAFALHRLFEQARHGAMSEEHYDQWGAEARGRLGGAIAEHAIKTESRLADSLDITADELNVRLAALFPQLVRVDIDSAPLLRHLLRVDIKDQHPDIVHALQRQGLLKSEGEGAQATASIAHETLFSAWPTLAAWVAQNRSALMLLGRAEVEAQHWGLRNHHLDELWSVSRLRELQWTIENLPDQQQVSIELLAFCRPQERLLDRCYDPGLAHSARQKIGHYLSELGDPRPGIGLGKDGLPEFDWVDIGRGRVSLEGKAGSSPVANFRISRYPVTNEQFQAFIEVEDGYHDSRWWSDVPAHGKGILDAPTWSESNGPRENVTWYEAVAFCRWLSAQRVAQQKSPVSLPTEFEWQQAATRGEENQIYPWGESWDARLCNSAEARLNRSNVVGLYPAGIWLDGPLDMAGNVEEWCLNKYDDPLDTVVDDSNALRGLRGGSWLYDPTFLRSAARNYSRPGYRANDIGFRVVCRARFHR